MSAGTVIKGFAACFFGWLSTLLGGFDYLLHALILFMVIDYVTGVLTGLVNKSTKSGSGGLSSQAGLWGICKKVIMLFFVAMCATFNNLLGLSYPRDVCVTFLIVNETISIIENAGLIGVPIPVILRKCVDLLNDKYEKEEEDEKK